MAQPLLRHREPHGGGDRAGHARGHLVGARPEAADARRLHPPEARLGEVRRQGDHEVQRPDRRRLRPVHAVGVQEGPVRALRGEPELLRRQARDRRGRLPRVQQRRRDGRGAQERRGRLRPRPARGRLPEPARGPGLRDDRGRAGRLRRVRAQRRRRAQEGPSRARRPGRAPGDRPRDRQADDHRPRAPRPRQAGLRDQPVGEPRVDPGDPRGPALRLRPRQGEADPRRRGLQGHRRRRRARDAGRRPAAEDALRGALGEPALGADGGVHHGLAQGDRDRHDAEDLRRRPAHGGHRQGRLRHVRLGLDPVRRPRPDAVVLHVRPRQPGSGRPDELLQRREPLRPGVRQALQAAEGRARPRQADGHRPPDADALLLAARSTSRSTTRRTCRPTARTSSTAGSGSPRRPGPVLFSNSSPSYVRLEPAAATAAAGGGGGGDDGGGVPG